MPEINFAINNSAKRKLSTIESLRKVAIPDFYMIFRVTNNLNTKKTP